jgi:phosphatidylserine/phosphatidylglycerophosphate/cardiolipin synthase-like enzyme
MYELQGSAAEDVLKTFVSRWNDPVPPTASDTLIPAAESLPLWLPSEQKGFHGYHGHGIGHVAMQVVRTFSCDATLKKGPLSNLLPGALPPLFQNFAPHGEYSYAAAFFKALRQATDYIFLADQFMWFDEAMAAVVEAAARDTVKYVFILTNPGLHMQLPMKLLGHEVEIDTYQAILQHYQYNALFGALAKKDPSGMLRQKVRMFSLEGSHNDSLGNSLIYDHEKTLLIDDEYALVGSTGVERTAFTNDADLSVAMHSKDLVAGLRRKMFSEWLGFPSHHKVLSTVESSFSEWLRQADMGTKRVRHYMPKEELSFQAQSVAPVLYRFLEADGRCKGDGYSHMWPAVLDAGTDRVSEHLKEMREFSAREGP